MPPKQPVKKGAAVTKKPSGGTASKPAASKSGAGKTAAAAKPAAEAKPAEPAIVIKDKPDLVTDLKTAAKALTGDNSPLDQAKKSGLVIDPTEKIATFLKYQNANCLTAVSPDDCIPEKIRLAVLGGIRYGKPVVIDVMDNPKMMNHIGTLMEEILPGLLNMIYDQSIKEEENYMKLVKEVDGPEYDRFSFSPERAKDFRLIIVTSTPFATIADPHLVARTFVISIE